MSFADDSAVTGRVMMMGAHNEQLGQPAAKHRKKTKKLVKKLCVFT